MSCIQALRTLEDGVALKCLDTKRACFATIGAAAVHHKQADSVASVLLKLVRKNDTLKTYDHLPAAVAEAADFVEKEMKSPQLVSQMSGVGSGLVGVSGFHGCVEKGHTLKPCVHLLR